MPIKQTRRSISVRGTTYDALRRFCETHQKSMSEIVEEQLARVLAGAPASTVKSTAKPARARTVAAPSRARATANKVVRAPAAPVAAAAPATRAPAPGRPAPKPARDLIAERPRAPKGDYRAIQF